MLCANLIVGIWRDTILASTASIASNDAIVLTTSKAAFVVSEAVVQQVDAIDGIVSGDPGASNSLHGRGVGYRLQRRVPQRVPRNPRHIFEEGRDRERRSPRGAHPPRCVNPTASASRHCTSGDR